MKIPANPTRKNLDALPKSRVTITVSQDGETWTLEVPVARVRFDIHMEERAGLDEEFAIFPLPPLTPETVLSVHMAPEMEEGQRSAWRLIQHTHGVRTGPSHRVYWGSHGCALDWDHDGPCRCSCGQSLPTGHRYVFGDQAAQARPDPANVLPEEEA